MAIVTAGPNSPSYVGSAVWGNRNWFAASKAAASDNAYASATAASGNVSSWYLHASGFGFAVPADAAVVGIMAEIERMATASAASAWVQDLVVSLHQAGVVTGNNLGTATAKWPRADAYTGYGTADDTWGLALTPAYVNSANFGFSMACRLRATGGKTTAIPRVDHMRMTVWYDVPGGEGGLLWQRRMMMGVGR